MACKMIFGTMDGVTDESKEVEIFKHQFDEMVNKVDELEQRVNEISQFYSSITKKQSNNFKGSSVVKEREKEKQIATGKKLPQDPALREAAAVKRMQELMRKFESILNQIKVHKWAWPFMEPVDVEGLGLHDYYEVIEKPMDFSTIQNHITATLESNGTGYKNVREAFADVQLVFKNAMTYNDEKSDVYVMAETVLSKFKDKWLQLLPKVIEEETRLKEEEAEAQAGKQLAQETSTAKLARDTSLELCDLDSHLEELREMIVQRCRKMTTEEKRKLGSGLSRLSPEDLNKALEIIAQRNPNFQATAEEVDLDMDAQSESTLWRLKFFVRSALEAQANTTAIKGQENSKRKREICDALAKTAKKRSKRLS